MKFKDDVAIPFAFLRQMEVTQRPFAWKKKKVKTKLFSNEFGGIPRQLFPDLPPHLEVKAKCKKA